MAEYTRSDGTGVIDIPDEQVEKFEAAGWVPVKKTAGRKPAANKDEK